MSIKVPVTIRVMFYGYNTFVGFLTQWNSLDFLGSVGFVESVDFCWAVVCLLGKSVVEVGEFRWVC